MSHSANIEQDIRRLTTALNKLDGAYYYYAKHMAVQENTLALFYALSDGQPHTQKQIGEEWLIPKTTINTIVRELVAAGYLVLAPQPHSREKTLVLTQAGQACAMRLVAQVKQAEQQALRKTLALYPPEFLDAFDYYARQLCREIGSLTQQ